MTPPIPNRLATSGNRQPSPPPPNPPPPNPPDWPVRASKLLLSGSPPSRIACLLLRSRNARPLAPVAFECACREERGRGGIDDSRRKSRAGHRVYVRHRPRNRQGDGRGG